MAEESQKLVFFRILQWINKGAKTGSTFAATDDRKPVEPPAQNSSGSWELLKVVAANRFTEAEKAKPAIERDGFYIMGGKVEDIEAPKKFEKVEPPKKQKPSKKRPTPR